MNEKWLSPWWMRVGTVLVFVLAGSACPNAGEDRILSVEATGAVTGVVYLDLDGNRESGAGDLGIEGVPVRLVAAGTRDTVAQASSGAGGGFGMNGVPVGQYEVVVIEDPDVVGDSIAIVRQDSMMVTVTPDSVPIVVEIGISFPVVSIREARGLALNTKVFVEGVVLNATGVFGDSTVHLVDTSGFIRLTRVRPPPVEPGDSARFLGSARLRDGQPTLDDAGPITLARVILPLAELVTTAAADTADGGRLDAAQVRVVDGTIIDTTRVQGDYIATVDDGSGPVDVVFDLDAGLLQAPYVPDAVVDVTGLLVPTGTGRWRLKPRFNADVVLK